MNDDELNMGGPGTLLQPQTLLCDRYLITRLIGHGGMGAVYEAQDRGLSNESIAIKLILPEYSGRKDLERRFRDEILLARHVTHPNVVRIFNLEKDGALLFITMELVNGEDLATLLERNGKYPAREATKIMYQAVSGIQAAHEAGVIHRDLKTRNIMLQPDGRVVVMDFGLARPLNDASRTKTAGTVGTFAYMAPEQLRFEPSDHRADLYSLGIVFHELLTGKLPTLTGSREEKRKDVLSQIFRKPGGAIASEKTDAELTRIVRKCLEEDPQKRYQSAKDLKEDIGHWLHPPAPAPRVARWMIGVAALAVIAALLFAWRIWMNATPPIVHSPVTVLIADFANLTGDPAFSGGVLESVLGIALEGSPIITSYSRGIAHREIRQLYQSDDLTEERARQIALRDGVQSVVGGSLDREGSNYVLQVTVRDADAEPRNPRRVMARSREEVLSALGDVAREIRRALGEKSPRPQRPETFTSSSVEATRAYAHAQELALEGKSNDSIPEYQHAILLDPSLGRAYAGLAVIYRNKNQIKDALRYYGEALKHFDRMTDREKYRTRGGYYMTSGSPDRAIEEYTQLVKDYPADNAGWANLALAWAFKRDMAKAIEYGKKAVDTYPKNVSQRCNLAWYLLFGGQYPEAITAAGQTLELNSKYEKPYIVVALAQLAQGNVPEAKKAYVDLRRVSAAGVSMATTGLADIGLYEGRIDEADSLLETGVRDDLATENASGAAAKLAMLAQSKLLAGRNAEALAAALQGDAIPSKPESALFQLAHVFVKLKPEKAEEIASQMAKSVDPDKRAYGFILKGELNLENKDTQAAIGALDESLRLADNWWTRYDLALAYLQAQNYAEADGQLEACIRRRGEAASVFIDDTPTYRYFPPVYYYHGLAEGGLSASGSKPWYEKFLAIKVGGGTDPMIEDARKHLNKISNGADKIEDK